MTLITEPVLWDGATDAENLFKPETKNDLFWLITRDGFYVHRPMAIGRAFIKHTPQHLPEFPYKNGVLQYNFQLLPKELMSQALDFFRRIWYSDKSEAEALILLNPDSGQLRLFIPPQRCTAGSVNSAYNPEHIGRGWQLIGSLHSHCNFWAGHSGTDTNDAAEFDGIHITIGHVDRDNPSFAAMVMINKMRKDYKIEEIADISDLQADTAPKFWDRYVITTERNDPKIIATWDRFKAPPRTPIRHHQPSYQYQPPVSHHSPAGPPTHHSFPVTSVRRWNSITNRWENIAADHNDSLDPYGNKPPASRHSRPTADDPDEDGFMRQVMQRVQNDMPNAASEDYADIQWYVADIMDSFYDVVDDLSELGLFPADLLELDELVRPNELLETALRIAARAKQADEPKAEPALIAAQAEGQITVDDVLRQH